MTFTLKKRHADAQDADAEAKEKQKKVHIKKWQNYTRAIVNNMLSKADLNKDLWYNDQYIGGALRL